MAIVSLTRRIFQLALRPLAVVHWIRVWRSAPVIEWIIAADRFRNKHFQLSASLYKAGLRRAPNHPAADCARLDLSYCQYRLGELESALETLAPITEDGVRLRDAFLLQAKIERYMGDSAASITTLSRCVQIFPRDPYVLASYTHTVVNAKGYHHNMNYLRQRLVQMRRKLRLGSHEAITIESALANFEMRFGDRKLGQRLLVRVLASGEAPIDAILLRGEQYEQMGRFEQARVQFQRAMVLEPRDPRPVERLARYHLRIGDEQGISFALQLARRACELSNWSHPQLLSTVVDCYEAMGDEISASLLSERAKLLLSTRQINLIQLKSLETQLEKLRTAKLVA